MSEKLPKNIVLFDGVCNLCNGFIDFLIKIDKNRILKYSSIQSEFSKTLGVSFEELSETEQSVFYINSNGEILNRSDAVIALLADINIIFIFLKFFLLFPKGFRDFFYKFVAKNRYRFFGKKETCRLPSPEEKELFI